MKINNKFFIEEPYAKGGNGIKFNSVGACIRTNLVDASHVENIPVGSKDYFYYENILTICRKRMKNIPESDRNEVKNRELIVALSERFTSEEIRERLFLQNVDGTPLNTVVPDGIVPNVEPIANANVATVTATKPNAKREYTAEEKRNALNVFNRLKDFFSEFRVAPSLRFASSLSVQENPVEFTRCYFEVQNHPCYKVIAEKIKSAEYKTLCEELKALTFERINSRITIFYGDAGTGKTTKALELAKSSGYLMACSTDMQPQNLLYDFELVNGQPVFIPTVLYKAMTEGKPIVLDEINFLSYETLKYMQVWTDSKDYVIFKDNVIEIKEGFHIYGTMNLHQQGAIYSLPEPLVDRCGCIESFELSGEDFVRCLYN